MKPNFKNSEKNNRNLDTPINPQRTEKENNNYRSTKISIYSSRKYGILGRGSYCNDWINL